MVRPWWARVPVAVWIIGAVVGAHVLFFWLVADKKFLPKTRYVPPLPPPDNFAARADTSVDPDTGETITEQRFVVSTHFSTPPPSPQPSVAPTP